MAFKLAAVEGLLPILHYICSQVCQNLKYIFGGINVPPLHQSKNSISALQEENNPSLC